MGGVVDILGGRSFASLWYWLAFSVAWTWVGRGALGIPTDLVRRIHAAGGRADGDGPAPGLRDDALLLLDWLSLVTPRWQVGARDGMVLIAAAAFVLSALAVLGFAYGRETAQAMVLLLGPLALAGALRVRLAAQLRTVLAAAEAGRLAPDAAAAQAGARIVAHLRTVRALSLAAVALAAVWGTLWMLRHPNGL